MKPLPDTKVEHWFLMHEEDCALSSTALAELAFGIAKLEVGIRQSKLQAQLAEWRVRFALRTFVFDVSAALTYGNVSGTARKEGHPMSVPDAQIASIAIEQSCQLATRNTKDFKTTGLQIINPWVA
jgi:predicted nucleic acid-binding protein